MQILLYGSDQRVCHMVQAALVPLEDLYSMRVVRDAEQLAAALSANDVAAIVIDAAVERAEDLCVQLSAATRAPILAITASQEAAERVLLLRAGADDAVARPFEPVELEMRLRAKLRRAFPEWHIGMTMLPTDRRLRLTPAELRLLTMLQRRTGTFVSAAELWQELWDDDMCSSRLRYHIFHLRRRLAELGNGMRIEAQRGHGYRLVGRASA